MGTLTAVLNSPLTTPPPSIAEQRARERADAVGTPFVVYRDDVRLQRLVPLAGRRLLLGRDERAAISVPWDLSVSRQHATLECTEAGWWIVDDGRSTNGTYVNYQPVEDRRLLVDGDVVQVGTTMLAFCQPG